MVTEETILKNKSMDAHLKTTRKPGMLAKIYN
jgi:hypothetical protein